MTGSAASAKGQKVSRKLVGRGALLVGAASTAVLLGGCGGGKKAEREAWMRENADLRERLQSYESALQQSESDKDTLMQRTRELEGELATATATPAAPTSGPGEFRGGDRVLTVAGDVLFASGQATIKSGGRGELNRIATMIQQQYPNSIVRVEGHTDTDQIRKSKWKDNEQLSAERALAVERYLVSRGVDRNRIYSAGMGSARPKATKESSRRVEIVILAGG